MKLEKIERGISSAEQARDRDELNISTYLATNASAFKSVVRVSLERVWLSRQASSLEAEHGLLEKVKMKREGEKTRIELRNDELTVAKRNLEERRRELGEMRADLETQRRKAEETKVEILMQRRRICDDLERIYPIEPIVGKSLAFSIRGVELPNTEYSGFDDDVLGTALGYTAHLVYLLSFYLNVKLRYPVYPAGNKSYVEDSVSVFQGSRTFPLWPRGSVYYRFEYGVFLLNKNIEQLMNSQSLLVIDLRHTLPNLKCLLLSMEANG
ncbi:UV radiation resistance protein and autophagy-related subunit 14-domain-containing protein [Kockiozyma suomiensis]|uniref:UV radiation resistance protein and autophagy-related subunit 14-domain-containing protein n=1 Tax=Kockiozyma suomiensis TaxID=1337062 RepID=UPI0033431AA9